MADSCEVCGKTIEVKGGDKLCPYCRSQQSICKEGKLTQKKINTAYVPYCKLKEKRATKGDGHWICYDCKHFIGS